MISALRAGSGLSVGIDHQHYRTPSSLCGKLRASLSSPIFLEILRLSPILRIAELRLAPRALTFCKIPRLASDSASLPTRIP